MRLIFAPFTADPTAIPKTAHPPASGRCPFWLHRSLIRLVDDLKLRLQQLLECIDPILYVISVRVLVPIDRKCSPTPVTAEYESIGGS